MRLEGIPPPGQLCVQVAGSGEWRMPISRVSALLHCWTSESATQMTVTLEIEKWEPSPVASRQISRPDICLTLPFKLSKKG